ncbi:Ig-like domain-containing protein [Cloacibacillus porcorum]|uniref:Ig-like domain-containing protein n=1 Tax=Cloacibacillus porcorum TaxID=1197717 RepID=UPI002A81D239|nr:Ig-like domain-containing protein [Cloacibacillus porcorum]MDD7650671.1 Ig-like domain-containing protein [Cloacibacillus porcorum]MDY4092653.1 Ig-like domain-containing protein [Cloacibacillus porcorum]
MVCAYTVDPASISFNREAGAANPIFRTWPGNNPAAVSEWETNVVSGVTLKQDTNQNTIISATKKGVFNVGASLILTATKFGKSDVVPLRLAGDTADTSSNPLLAPALSAVVRVTSDITRVKSIKITNAPQSLKEGEAFNLSCEVLPEDATNKDLVWSSSNNKVAAVTGQSGEITALLAGETVITVEARDGSGIRDQFTLTVKKDYLSNPKPERPAVKTDTAALSKPEYYGESEIEELAKAISMDKSLLTAKEDGSVILRQDVVGVALESVKKENPGLYYESVMPVPLIKAACGSAESGRIIAFGFTVSGDNFGKADSARDIKVMKVLPDGRGVLFKAIGEEREIEDRSCALYKGGEIYSGPVMPEDNYLLTLFIKDGGEFDLDGAENGSVIDPLVVLKAKEAPARESSSGGGCSAGFGGAALLAFAALPVLLRGRRRR